MDTAESSAPRAHPSIEEQDDAVEAHYSGLVRLRPHACNDGWITIGQDRARPRSGRGDRRVRALPLSPLRRR